MKVSQLILKFAEPAALLKPVRNRGYKIFKRKTLALSASIAVIPAPLPVRRTWKIGIPTRLKFTDFMANIRDLNLGSTDARPDLFEFSVIVRPMYA